MTRRRLTRVFWLGAAAILVAAAPISLVAVVRGGFSETDGRDPRDAFDDVELVATRRPAGDLVVTDRPRGGERLVLRHRR